MLQGHLKHFSSQSRGKDNWGSSRTKGAEYIAHYLFPSAKGAAVRKTAQPILLVTEAWRTKAAAHNQHLLLGN